MYIHYSKPFVKCKLIVYVLTRINNGEESV